MPRYNGFAPLKLSIDKCANQFSIQSIDDYTERNAHIVDYASADARKYAKAEGMTEDAASDYVQAAEDAASDELATAWKNDFDAEISRLFENVGLDCVVRWDNAWDQPGSVIVWPSHGNTWDSAAEAVREIINGYGLCHAGDTLAEFREIECRTSRQIVASHLGTLGLYDAVYGGRRRR